MEGLTFRSHFDLLCVDADICVCVQIAEGLLLYKDGWMGSFMNASHQLSSIYYLHILLKLSLS